MTNAACIRIEPLSTISSISIIASSPLNIEGLPGVPTTSFSTSPRQSPAASILKIVLKFCVTSKNSPKANPPLFLLNAQSLILFRTSVCSVRHARNWSPLNLLLRSNSTLKKSTRENLTNKLLLSQILIKGFEYCCSQNIPDNQQRLKSILKLCNNPTTFKNFSDDLNKLSILSSFPSTTLRRNRFGIITRAGRK